MTDRDALVAAVLANPAEDTPRLVYADWLDDHDEPELAAFIRVQVELARTPMCCPICNPETGHRDGCANGDRGDDLRRRERELWTCHGRTWLAGNPLEKYDLTWQDRVIWRRGFPDELRVPTLATLFGEPCGRCGGDDDVSAARRVREVTGAYTIACPACAGTGTTPGIAAAVFASHPVTRVVIGDREPYLAPEAGYVWWRRSANVPSDESANIPDDLFRRIPWYRGGILVIAGNSRDAALLALSRACVDLGRSRAGLGLTEVLS